MHLISRFNKISKANFRMWGLGRVGTFEGYCKICNLLAGTLRKIHPLLKLLVPRSEYREVTGSSNLSLEGS